MRTVADPRFAAELRRLRQEANLTQERLATMAASVKGHISDMERGTRTPSKGMADNLDRALCAGGQLTQLVNEIAALNADELDRLDYVTVHPRRIDAAAVGSLRQVLAGLRSADDFVGSAAVLPLATANQRLIQDLVTGATGPIRREVLDLGAQWAQFLGWLHTTGANWAMAKTHFDRALTWATERGDADMIATVLSYEGHCHWLRGEFAPVADMSKAARRDSTIYVGQLAYDAYQEARGLAATEQAAAAKAVLAEADELAEANEEWSGPIPTWNYYRARWFFALERGLVYRCLARYERPYAARAVEELAAGLEGMPPEWRGAEWAAEYMCYLASAYRTTGDLVAAREHAEQTRQVATQTNSARVLAMVDRVEQGL